MHKTKNRLLEMRKKENLTQKQLAEKSGVGRTTISNIENRVYIPGVDVALKITHALGYTVEDVFMLKGDNAE